MEQPSKRFPSFEDLEAYKAARRFRIRMYGVARRLPGLEKFELASQIRRAAVSLTNNIAEGHGRWHYLDHIKFLLQARGSLAELVGDLNVCEDEKYLSLAEIIELKQDAAQALKLLNGYLRYLRDCKIGSSLVLHEGPADYGDNDEDLEDWLAALSFESSASRPG